MNKFEKKVKEKYEAEGWTVLRKGWPDFLLTKKAGNKLEVMAVEVKSKRDKLRDSQYDVLEALQDAGLEIHLAKEGFGYSGKRDKHSFFEQIFDRRFR